MRLRYVAAALAVLASVAAVQMAADVSLTGPAPTQYVTDDAGGFITQAGHESIRSGGGRQVDYGYWPVSPPHDAR